jgi:hypothetical protein
VSTVPSTWGIGMLVVDTVLTSLGSGCTIYKALGSPVDSGHMRETEASSSPLGLVELTYGFTVV